MAFNVLITREPGRARPLIAELESRGIHARAVPVTQTVPAADRGPVPDLRSFDWLVFTSRRAVEVFCDDLVASGLDLPDRLRMAAVGTATAEAAAQRLHPPDLLPERATGADLGRTLVQYTRRHPRSGSAPRPRVLWPCARRTAPGLAQVLEQAGWTLVPWPCYETVPAPPAVLRNTLRRLDPWDACVFAAPSAVRAFAAAWPPPWRFVVVTIGPTTAGAVRDLGLGNPVVSRAPDVHALADAVEQALEACA